MKRTKVKQTKQVKRAKVKQVSYHQNKLKLIKDKIKIGLKALNLILKRNERN